jgi:ATP-binding cassette subfamily A (ABC1) protein 12
MDSMSQIQFAPNYNNFTRYTKLKGRELYMQQLSALFLKRFHHYRRNMRILATNIILPCLFVAMSMTFTTIRPKLVDQPALQLTPAMYDPSSIFHT